MEGGVESRGAGVDKSLTSTWNIELLGCIGYVPTRPEPVFMVAVEVREVIERHCILLAPSTMSHPSVTGLWLGSEVDETIGDEGGQSVENRVKPTVIDGKLSVREAL